MLQPLIINQNAISGLLVPMFPSTALRLAYIPAAGEKVYDSQLKAVFIGDGYTVGGNLLTAWPVYLTPGIQFEASGTLTSAGAATPVILIADALIPTGKAVYINWWMVSVGGATAWTDATGTIVTITDSTPTVAITFAKAGLTGKAILVPGSANTTYADLIPAQSGLGVGKGIQVVADHSFTGSDLKVTVGGYIK
jgi:hypothetical protein